MTRIVALALLVALLAGAGTVAAGGVELGPEQQARIDREAAKPFAVPAERDVLPPAPSLAPVASPAPGPLGATVTMRRLAFGRQRVEVRAGQSVRWVNRDRVAHRLQADDGGGAGVPPSFASDEIQPGASYRTTFTTPGVFRYVCTLHPSSMVAYVVVR